MIMMCNRPQAQPLRMYHAHGFFLLMWRKLRLGPKLHASLFCLSPATVGTCQDPSTLISDERRQKCQYALS